LSTFGCRYASPWDCAVLGRSAHILHHETACRSWLWHRTVGASLVGPVAQQRTSFEGGGLPTAAMGHTSSHCHVITPLFPKVTSHLRSIQPSLMKCDVIESPISGEKLGWNSCRCLGHANAQLKFFDGIKRSVVWRNASLQRQKGWMGNARRW